MPTVGTEEFGGQMPKYVIERELPDAGSMSVDQLQEIARSSNRVLADLGPEIQWDHSYVTADKLYCVYIASDEDIVMEHARCGGFPANSVSAVTTIIDPTTAE